MNLRKEPRIFGFRNKEKYKEHDRMDNIIIGKGELIYIEEKQGWITPTGEIIQDKEQAIKLATKIDQLYQRLHINKCIRANSFTVKTNKT